MIDYIDDRQSVNDAITEKVAFQVMESFPNMIFAKHGEKELRTNYEKGFRYAYFNAIMDHESGFCRTDMIGQNATDHFPVDFKRYFVDDQEVMNLAPNSLAMKDIYEPWKVKTAQFVLHTRKTNLDDKYMLGTFIKVDDLHLGKQEEARRRPTPLPLSPPPPSPEEGFFYRVLEWLPLPVLISFPTMTKKGPYKNKAYQQAFAIDDDDDENTMDAFLLR